MVKIEVCSTSIKSVINAQKNGADRIELCSELAIGGITPSKGLILEARKYSKIPIKVLIRPRSGDFNYSKEEIEVIKRDIITLNKIGVDGIVIGITDEIGNLPVDKLKSFVDLAGSLSLTFHRAFDVLKNPIDDLEKLIDLGFDTILTSGQKENVYDGIGFLNEIKKIAGNRISIMPGGGISLDNCLDFKNNGFEWIHLSSKKVRIINQNLKNNISFLSQPVYDLDPQLLKSIKKRLVS